MIKIIVKNYLNFFSHHKMIYVATLSILTFTFLVMTLFFNIYYNMMNIVHHWSDLTKMTVYLKDGLSQDQINNIKTHLESQKFTQLKYASKEEASEQFKKQMKEYLPDLLNDEEFRNPFPASFDLGIPEDLFRSLGINGLREKAKGLLELEGVEDVSYGGDWIQNYRKFAQFIFKFGWTILLILLFAGFFVIGNSIRISIEQRRDEVEILELIGATDSLIRWPFIFEGAMTGLISSVVALSLGYTLYQLSIDFVQEHLSFWSMGAQLSFLSPLAFLGVILSGVLTGAIGSYICVSRLNDGWSASHRLSQ